MLVPSNTHTYMHISHIQHIHTLIYSHIHIHVCTHSCIYAHSYIHTHLWIYIILIHIHKPHTCKLIYSYVHIHRKHTHTHTLHLLLSQRHTKGYEIQSFSREDHWRAEKRGYADAFFELSSLEGQRLCCSGPSPSPGVHTPGLMKGTCYA